MFTDTRGYERGSRLANDLCLEISQTSSCTSLQLVHSVMTILIHSQMFKVFFSLLFWCSVAVLTELRFGQYEVESTPHEGGVSCKVVFLKCKSSCISVLTPGKNFTPLHLCFAQSRNLLCVL